MKQTKQIKHQKEALKSLFKGVLAVSKPVAKTLGPKGRNAIIARDFSPLITNDGVTIAKEITLKNKFENIGASVIKEASIKTNSEAGDGTTTACVLASSLIENLFKKLKHHNPFEIRNGLNLGLNTVLAALKAQISPAASISAIYAVAKISSASSEIAGIIADCYKQVGVNGVLTLSESKTSETYLKTSLGMELDKGLYSPYFANENTQELIIDNPKILITNKKITSQNEILPLLEETANSGSKLVLIAEEIDENILNLLILNKLRGAVSVAVIKAPSFGENRINLLKDLAILSKTTFCDASLNPDLSLVKLKDLGTVKQIKADLNKTVVVSGKQNSDHILKHVETLKEEIKNKNLGSFAKENLEKRIAYLSSGVAEIYVGAATEVELSEKKLRIEDALNATKVAIASGIVCGSGKVFLNCLPAIQKLLLKNLTQDEKIGVLAIKEALSAPFKQILKNTGLKKSKQKQIYKKILNSDKTFGYDAKDNKFVNLKKAKIFDPYIVSKNAITTAVSVAGTLITTTTVIAGD